MAIARAVMKQPEIYVFDDSFSALDMKTERQLRQNLREAMEKQRSLSLHNALVRLWMQIGFWSLMTGVLWGREHTKSCCKLVRCIGKSRVYNWERRTGRMNNQHVFRRLLGYLKKYRLRLCMVWFLQESVPSLWYWRRL